MADVPSMRLAAARKRRSSSSVRLDNHCTPGTVGLPARLASSTFSCPSLPPLGRPSPELVSAVTPTSAAALATPPVLITPHTFRWTEQFPKLRSQSARPKRKHVHGLVHYHWPLGSREKRICRAWSS